MSYSAEGPVRRVVRANVEIECLRLQLLIARGSFVDSYMIFAVLLLLQLGAALLFRFWVLASLPGTFYIGMRLRRLYVRSNLLEQEVVDAERRMLDLVGEYVIEAEHRPPPAAPGPH
jgi:hypothetical protein